MRPHAIFASIFVLILLQSCRSVKTEHQVYNAQGLEKIALQWAIEDSIWMPAPESFRKVEPPQPRQLSNTSVGAQLPRTIPQPAYVRKTKVTMSAADSTCATGQISSMRKAERTASPASPLPGLIISVLLLCLVGVLLSRFVPGKK